MTSPPSNPVLTIPSDPDWRPTLHAMQFEGSFTLSRRATFDRAAQ